MHYSVLLYWAEGSSSHLSTCQIKAVPARGAGSSAFQKAKRVVCVGYLYFVLTAVEHSEVASGDRTVQPRSFRNMQIEIRYSHDFVFLSLWGKERMQRQPAGAAGGMDNGYRIGQEPEDGISLPFGIALHVWCCERWPVCVTDHSHSLYTSDGETPRRNNISLRVLKVSISVRDQTHVSPRCWCSQPTAKQTWKEGEVLQQKHTHRAPPEAAAVCSAHKKDAGERVWTCC